MEKFLIIDGNSLINRAFYALPALKTLDGKPCGAVFGFVNMMLSVVQSEKPKYLVCVFDAGKHTFRTDMYAEYKGTRDKMPEDLAIQLGTLQELLNKMGILVLKQAEIEADDIVGTLTRKFNEQFILLSGDKDLLQLINKNTSVWLTQKGISNVLKVDEQVLKKEFNLSPYQVIELKSIMGDSADNIPGVAGIGKVGAQKLIDEFKDLDNVYKNLESLSKGTQQKLTASKEMAYLSKQLATIKLDVEIDCTLKDCEFSLPFNNEVYYELENLGFKSILNRKELFNKDEKSQKSVASTVEAEIKEIGTQDEFDEMLKCLGDSFAVGTDNLSIILSNKKTEFVLYTSGTIFANNTQKIKELLEGEQQKVVFDAKQLMHYFEDYNIQLKNYFDVSLAIYVANEMDAEITLDDALKLNDITTQTKTSALLKLKEVYVNQLISSRQLKLFSEIELPLVEVLFNMEKAGICVDVEQIKGLSKNYHSELDDITKTIYKIAGKEFNINSPKQLQTVLFEDLKIEYKGKVSTSIEVLNEIKNKHEIVDYIIRYRKIAKLISTYLDGMLQYVNNNKIHTTFMQRTTSTGRLSSREPNLQNLPIRDDEGKQLRKMFVSSFKNGTMISADYNQIELRLMANFSQDENMINDYLSGKDIHRRTASKIFSVPLEDVTSKMRRMAKSVNFGIIYGIGAYGLSQNINSTVKEAGEFINKYFEIYPKIKTYGQKCIDEARENGFSKTIMGRIRHVPDIHSSNHVMRSFAERVAKNMPLQGSASDIIKIAMISVNKQFEQNKLNSKLVLQIHDELVVDCYPGESKQVKTILKQVMENVVDLRVPLLVEIEEGETLFDAK